MILTLNREDVEGLVDRLTPEVCSDLAPLPLLLFRGKLEGARIWLERHPTEVVAFVEVTRAEAGYYQHLNVPAVAGTT